MGVSKNNGTPKSSILIGFSMKFSPSILGVFPLFLRNNRCIGSFTSHLKVQLIPKSSSVEARALLRVDCVTEAAGFLLNHCACEQWKKGPLVGWVIWGIILPWLFLFFFSWLTCYCLLNFYHTAKLYDDETDKKKQPSFFLGGQIG